MDEKEIMEVSINGKDWTNIVGFDELKGFLETTLPTYEVKVRKATRNG